MAIWLILFAVTFLVSLFMAYRSMSDYYEQASHFPAEYSQYLVGDPENLTPEIISRLHQSAFDSRLILSFERLFKGPRRALVIFGPVNLLHSLFDPLKLTEIEDYTPRVGSKEAQSEAIASWGVGKKKGHSGSFEKEKLFQNMPELLEDEEVWWQVVVQPKDNKSDNHFESIIRVVLAVANPQRAKFLKEELVKLGQEEGLAELPKAYSTEQMLKLYQERALHKEYTMTIEPKDVLSLVEV